MGDTHRDTTFIISGPEMEYLILLALRISSPDF